MANKKGETILVAGAPGNRKGMAVRNLLRNVWTMRTFSSNPSRAETQLVAEKRGQRVRQGHNNRASENKTLQGILRVIQVRTVKKHGLVKETRHGKILVHAAKTARIKYFIRRSFDDAQGSSGIQHARSTWDMEQYMRSWLACNHLPAGLFQ